MRPIGGGLKRFWEKAYQDNLTGLAGMVAYNLLLSIFPVGLIALFVAGQILAAPQLERSVLVDLQELFPSATASTLDQTLNDIRSSSTTAGIVALVASVWVGASFWGALDTAFCRIYELPCRSWVRQKLFALGMLGLVLLFFAATVAMPALQSLLFTGNQDLPFGLSNRDALYTVTLGVGLTINFAALAMIYRTVPNASIPWHGVWPGALGATVAIGVIDYGFPFYLTNFSAFAGLRTTLVFVLIVLVWFYALALIILAGAVLNELRLVGRRSDTLATMPDPETEEMRLEQIERERKEHRQAARADEEAETDQHERRAERAGYLREKLEERAEAEDAAEASVRAGDEPPGAR
jgi:membrane protein